MRFFRIIVLSSLLAGSVYGSDAAGIEFFENHIRPIFVEHCYTCHSKSADNVKANLYLDSREGVLAGGDSGSALSPGDAAQSLLMKAIGYGDQALQMPPKYKLDESNIRRVREWIEMGAPDPRDDATFASVREEIDLDAGRAFWSFQAVQASAPPAVGDSRWPLDDIDRFIFSKLEAKGLAPNDPADSETLIRRIYFDLIGFPPTPEQIDGFTREATQENLATIVDELLDMPEFGERWGRHWLDVARFAESSGGGRSLMFEHAWRYRDYVIAALNKDKPFNEFIVEQIAGDLLPSRSAEEYNERLTASGYLMLGPINYEQQDKELLRMEVIDEQIDTVGRTFLGMTLGCARCHDHKFDPIPARDYYAMAGIFGSTQSLIPGNVSGFITQSLRLPGHTEEDMAAVEEANVRKAELAGKIAKLEDQISNARVVKSKGLDPARFGGIVIDDTDAVLVGYWQESTSVGGFLGDGYVHDEGKGKGQKRAIFSPAIKRGGRYEVRISYTAGQNRATSVPIIIHHQDGRDERRINQTTRPSPDGAFESLGIYRFEADTEASITIETAGTDAVVIVDAVQLLHIGTDVDPELAGLEASKEPSSGELASLDKEAEAKIAKLRSQKQKLEADLSLLREEWPIQDLDVAMSVKDADSVGDSPLLIRGVVRNHGPIVPRGVLQVATLSEQSAPEIPSNQSGRLELAYWIASEDNPLTSRVIVNRIWHHLFGEGIVRTPDNFGTMGELPSHPELLDYLAKNFVEDGWSIKSMVRRIVLSRSYQMSSDAESEKLAIDSENRLFWRMNRKRLEAESIRDSMLLISGQLDPTRGGLTIRKIEQYDLDYKFDSRRRSIYVPNFRNSVLDIFEVFDMANPNLVVGRRTDSIRPTQSLFMMNSSFVVDLARHAAARWGSQIADDQDEGIEQLYRTILGRYPSAEEAELTRAYLDGFGREQEDLAVESLCHSLFASIDFRTVY